MNENQRLNGWKEISNYVDRTPKTVQRWEKNNGFPVHRIEDKKSVYAFTNEIDQWFEPGQSTNQSESRQPIPDLTKRLSILKWGGISLLVICIGVVLYYFLFFLPHLENRKLMAEAVPFTKGSILRITDQDRRPLLSFASNKVKYQRFLFNSFSHTYLVFSDLNHDGIEDVVFADQEMNTKNPLQVYLSNHFGRLIKQTHIKDISFVYPIEEEQHKLVLVGDIEVADLDQDGEDEIIVVQRSKPYYPSCVRVFKQNGREVFRLLHPGHFENAMVRDLDQDGNNELYIAGCNNRLHEYSLPIFLKIVSN